MEWKKAIKHMLRENILSEIKYCQRKIDSYEAQIRTLKKQIECQQHGLNKFKTIKSDLENVTRARISAVNEISASCDNNRTAQLYAGGMKNFLTGSRAKTANQNLENMKRKMSTEISKNEEKVSQLKHDIYKLNNRIEDLRHELRHLQQQPNHS